MFWNIFGINDFLKNEKNAKHIRETKINIYCCRRISNGQNTGSKKTSGFVICLLTQNKKNERFENYLEDMVRVKKNERNCYLFANRK